MSSQSSPCPVPSLPRTKPGRFSWVSGQVSVQALANPWKTLVKPSGAWIHLKRVTVPNCSLFLASQTIGLVVLR